MKLPFRLSLTTKLVLLCVATISPVILIGLLLFRENTQIIETLIQSNDKAAALAQMANMALQASFYLLFAGIVSLAAAAHLAQRLTKPITDLTDRAREIQNGTMVGNVQVPSGNELAELATAFNSMSAHLALQQDQLTRKAQQMEGLLGQLLAVRDEERVRIGSELHDSVVQEIVGALYQIESSMDLIQFDPGLAKEKLEQARLLLDSSVTDVRHVISGLHLPILDDMGIVPAIRQFVSDCNLADNHCELAVFGRPRRFPREIEIAVYRVAQEALGNAWNHSQSSQVWMGIRFSPNHLSLIVKDNGVGFDVEEMLDMQSDHFGLQTMRERARKIGAELRIVSFPGRGSRVSLHLPLAHKSIEPVGQDSTFSSMNPASVSSRYKGQKPGGYAGETRWDSNDQSTYS